MSKQRKITVRDKPSTKKKIVKKKKLLTPAQVKKKNSKIKIFGTGKRQIKGSSGSLGLISPGKVLKGGKMLAKYISKKLTKKAAVKLVDKKVATAKKKSKTKRSKNSKA